MSIVALFKNYANRELSDLHSLPFNWLPKISSFLQDSPEFPYLDLIKGIGKNTTPVFVAFSNIIRDALSSEQFAGFCGLTPCEKKPGKSTGQADMSKAGPPILRWALFLVADCIRKYDPKLKDLYQRVKNRHKSQGKKIARLVGACAVARELAMLIWAVVKFQRPYFLQQEEYKKFVASLYPKIIRSLSNLQDENWNVKSKNK